MPNPTPEADVCTECANAKMTYDTMACRQIDDLNDCGDTPGRRSNPEMGIGRRQMLMEMALSASTREAFKLALSSAREAGREQATPFGGAVLGMRTTALARALEDWLAQATAMRRGRPPIAAALLDRVEPTVAAALALRALVERLSTPRSLASVAIAVGEAVEDEALMRSLRESDAEAYAALLRGTWRTSSRSKRHGRWRAAVERAEQKAWSAKERELVGLRLIDLAIAATGLVEIREERRGKKRLKQLVPTEAALEAMRDSDASAEIRPVREPMIAPPKSWYGVWGGGYLTDHLPRLPLLKTRRREALEALDLDAAPEVFSAVNVAQATAWRINGEILDVIDTLELCGVEAPGAPEPRPAPSSAKDEEGNDARAALREWRKAESLRRAHRSLFESARATARRFREFDRIWFPVQLDFRGRLYFTPAFNPQGPDLTRSLLQFAEGKPLGEEGWKWLAIHLCNCGDFTKMSKAPLSARVEWVLDNEERILTVAADPLADDWWMEADAPWQFLAACFEWRGFCEEGEAFRSRLPIALDGSCSGLQHFSLALRDANGGRAVNLSATDKASRDGASDIYQEVAARVAELMRADLDADDSPDDGADGAKERIRKRDLAKRWLAFGVDRAVAKRPTMTYGYGASGYGFARMILDDTLAPARAAWVARGAVQGDPSWPFERDAFAAALYLSARLTEAIEQTVLKAAETMRWLQEAAGLAAAADLPLRWTTPDGFPVIQHYPEMHGRRIKTAFGETIVRLSVREESGRLDRRRQRQGAAPNYVHSLDACHLRMTVNRAKAEGIESFALVHDSFGVHAADTPRFFQIIREAMVDMYDREDVVGRFHDEISRQLPDRIVERLTAPPEQGALDLADVLESEFCFA